MFRSWFSGGKTQEAPEVLGLTIGRMARFDPVELKLLPSDSLFAPPRNDFVICAQGHCDLGEQSHLHRFYPEDDRYLIQIQGGDGREENRVDELVLWYVHDVHYLNTETAWEAMADRIRQPRFALAAETGETEFERAWFEHSNAPEEPMTYWEEVRDDRAGQSTRHIFQTAMLFARQVSDGRDDMLLVNMEQPESSDERSVSFLIGRAIPEHCLST